MRLRYALLFLLLSLSASAQPKREFRGAWIATVSNVDWPISKTDSPGQQQSDLTALLDSLSRVGFNAVVFQIRPSADALYQSSLEPWSEWLTGVQGQAPGSPWDPLAFAISQARLRGMELHAWFNPYRTVVSTSSSSVAATHISNTHPEWNLQFGTLKMLNPGLPEVRAYVLSVIMDVVRRYDIDGVHFDDYFYPYSGITTEDQTAYAAYGGGLPLGDWRRDNVNKLIKMVHDSIQAVKPRVKFGISPFGIWRNQSTDASGSATSGLQSYDAIYCDTKYWLQQGWIDYVTPQVYWRMGYSVANYSVLAPWWNQNSSSRHVYVGQAPYRMFNSDNWPAWEVVNQINLNRTLPNVLGSVHFSAKYFGRSTYLGRKLNDTLKGMVYQQRALRPTMAWKDPIPPNPPDSVRIQDYTGFGLVKWNPPAAASDGETVTEYLMYRSSTLPINFSDMRNARFMALSTSWAEGDPYPGESVYIAVTALDRHQNESAPSNIVSMTTTGIHGLPDESMVPAAMRLDQNFPNPFNPATVIGFEVVEESYATLRVYDLLGREVAALWDGMALPGYRQVTFDGAGFPSGTYFYRLMTAGRVETKRMQLVR